MKELTPLDQHVKSCMLRYPTLFADRTSVLVHLFLVLGNGYDWDEKTGMLTDACEETSEPIEMKYDDLDLSRDQERFAHLREIDENVYQEIVGKYESENSIKRQQREIVAANIDFLARTKPLMASVRYGHYEHPRSIIDLVNSGYLFAEMAKVPEASYLAGALEILEAVRTTYMHDDELKPLTGLLVALMSQIKSGNGVSKLVLSPDDGDPRWYRRAALRMVAKQFEPVSIEGQTIVYATRKVSPAEEYTLERELRLHGFVHRDRNWTAGQTEVEIIGAMEDRSIAIREI